MDWEGCLRKEVLRDLLRYIAKLERQGKNPLYRDLSSDLKRPLTTVHAQAARLEEDGFIEVDGGFNQTKVPRLTEKGRAAAYRLGAPVLGTVPAGLTRFVPETDGRGCEGEQLYRETWDDVLPPDERHSILVVKGDSMIGDCIREGDEVHLRRGRRLCDIADGQIAAVMVGDDYEATLKHVHFDADAGLVTLRASNPKYEPIVADAADVRVVGTLKGVIRLEPMEVNRK